MNKLRLTPSTVVEYCWLRQYRIIMFTLKRKRLKLVKPVFTITVKMICKECRGEMHKKYNTEFHPSKGTVHQIFCKNCLYVTVHEPELPADNNSVVEQRLASQLS